MILSIRLKIVFLKVISVILIFITQAFNNISISQAQTEEMPNVEDILDSIISQVNFLPPYSSHGVSTLKWSRPEGNGISITEFDLRWDGLKSDVIANMYDMIENEKVLIYSNRSISDGNQQITKQVSISSSQQKLDVVGLSRVEQSQDGFKTRTFGTYILKYGGSEERLVDLLRHSSDLTVKMQMEKVDGYSCFVLEGKTQKGHLCVWIDPKAGYNIRKIVGHSNYEDNISEVVIDNIEISKIDNIWIPMSATFHEILKDSDSNILNNIKIINERTQIDFNPDFEKIGAFKMDGIPNGFRVIDFDFPGLLYEWQNGDVIPYVDKYVIDEMDKVTQQIISNGDVPPKLGSVKESINIDAEPNALGTIRSDGTKPKSEVLSETGFSLFMLLIPIGLLIIAVIGWQLFGRFKT